MGNKLRGGWVVSLRVNPQDCMAVADVLTKMGISTVNLSFSQATKIVLASAFETLRGLGYIPTRDGFEFSEMMAPFERDRIRTRKMQLRIAEDNASPMYKAEPLIDSPERKQRRIRYEELTVRQKGDPINFSEDDLLELVPLIEEFQ